MNDNNGLPLVAPRLTPVLDPCFRPAVLANRAFRALARASGNPVNVHLALEQADGSVFHYATEILPTNHPHAAGNARYIERLVKFLLWAWGGWRIHVAGPHAIVDSLQRHFRDTATGRFDSDLIGVKVYERPIEVVHAKDIPPARASTAPLGRHLDGCRIGFDLGGSDRKV
ncbi:MAG: ROK family protein, partial [Verrucomicrobiota bacterium]